MKMSAPRLGTKRKYVQRVIREPKHFVSPLMQGFPTRGAHTLWLDLDNF